MFPQISLSDFVTEGYLWQELAVHFAVQLLSPPVGDNWGGNSGNALIGHAPMLYAALQGMNNADALNVLSLFGMVLKEPYFTLVLSTDFRSVSLM